VRIVLDTNILVRANPKVPPRGLARDLLLKIVSGPHELVLSPAILMEVQRVLTYPHVQARWPLTPEAIDQYPIFLEAAGILVETPTASSPVAISDPDDGHCGVVENRCRAHGIRILDDVTLMQELRR